MGDVLVLLDGLWWISFVMFCGAGLVLLLALIDDNLREDD